MVTELTDPIRDYKKFDYKRRALELFLALDEDGSGGVSETEYLKGCKSDKHFVKLLIIANIQHHYGMVYCLSNFCISGL